MHGMMPRRSRGGGDGRPRDENTDSDTRALVTGMRPRSSQGREMDSGHKDKQFWQGARTPGPSMVFSAHLCKHGLCFPCARKSTGVSASKLRCLEPKFHAHRADKPQGAASVAPLAVVATHEVRLSRGAEESAETAYDTEGSAVRMLRYRQQYIHSCGCDVLVAWIPAGAPQRQTS